MLIELIHLICVMRYKFLCLQLVMRFSFCIDLSEVRRIILVILFLHSKVFLQLNDIRLSLTQLI